MRICMAEERGRLQLRARREKFIQVNYNCTYRFSNQKCKICFTVTLCLNSVEITNKMQPCNRIYYSTVH